MIERDELGRFRGLTPRGLEILWWRAKGLTIPDVATELGIGESTAHRHTILAYRDLGVSSFTDALAALGWLTIPPAPPLSSRPPSSAFSGTSRTGGGAS